MIPFCLNLAFLSKCSFANVFKGGRSWDSSLFFVGKLSPIFLTFQGRPSTGKAELPATRSVINKGLECVTYNHCRLRVQPCRDKD